MGHVFSANSPSRFVSQASGQGSVAADVCATCRYSLIGERQKGHVYYRCHTKDHPSTCIREEVVQAGVAKLLQSLHFSEGEKEYLRGRLETLRADWTTRLDEEVRSVKLRLDQIKDRMNRLTDAFLDQALDKTMFEERKKALLLEQKETEDSLGRLTASGNQGSAKVEKFLELAEDAWLGHELGLPDENGKWFRFSPRTGRLSEKS